MAKAATGGKPRSGTSRGGTKRPAAPPRQRAPRPKAPPPEVPEAPFLVRAARVLLAYLLIIGIGVIVAIFFTAEPNDPVMFPPRAGAATIEVAVVDHGWHTGLVVPTDRLRQFAYTDGHTALIEISERFLAHRFVEIGWGDADFYRTSGALDVPTLIQAGVALAGGERATVLHVVGLDEPPAAVFGTARIATLALSEGGFRRLATFVEESFDLDETGSPVNIGPGRYGDSLFFTAIGHYSLLTNCNHWIAHALGAAGVPTSRITDTLSAGLMANLRWRAGAS